MDKETIVTYDRFAAEYDAETRVFWEKFPRTVLDEFARLVRQAGGGNNILDLGSGPGRDARLLKDLGLEVTCIDASRAMVTLVINQGFRCCLMDLVRLAFEKESFDGVWAYTSLLHIPKASLPKALEGVHGVLGPDGIFGLGMINGNSEGFIEDESMKGAKRYFAYYEEEELRRHLAGVGFRVVFFEKMTPKSRTYLHFICEKLPK